MSKYVLKLRIVSPDDHLNSLYKEAVNKMNTEEYMANPHKDSGFDVFTPKENLKIGPGGTKLVDMKIQCAAYRIVCDNNTCVKVPTAFFMYPRSSIYKSSVRLANNTGIIDSGYRGELMIKLSQNDALGYYSINERVGQLMILPYPKIEFEESDHLTDTVRGTGGFGSTGKS